jgi:Domain of unknown function (DUF1996)
LPTVNAALIPVGSSGFGGDRVEATSDLPANHNNREGAFRVGCAFSHMNFDDPIVFPGQVGRSHLHSFFGNTALTANTTAANITATGSSTCTGGTVNRSGYWVPSIIDTLDGRPIAPLNMVVYYKTELVSTEAQLLASLPPGLRMIAGDPMAKSAPADQFAHKPALWSCDKLDGSGSYFDKSLTIPACNEGDYVVLGVEFPNCWDGVNLDSPDHKSHMFYGRGACPASHPKAIPNITFTVRWPAKSAGRWRLSSDNYASSTPAGYSAHADWFNGWKPAVSDVWLRDCVSKGIDCHADLLGDGNRLY